MVRQRNKHNRFYMNKIRSYVVILLEFTVNAITQSFKYILLMITVRRDHREFRVIPKLGYNHLLSFEKLNSSNFMIINLFW